MVHRQMHDKLARNLRTELDDGSDRPHGPALAEAVINDALRERATDIHVEPTATSGAVIRFRIDGSLVDVAALTPDQVLHLNNQLRVQAQIDPLPATHPKSSRWTAENDQQSVDIRLSVLSALGGERTVLKAELHAFRC